MHPGETETIPTLGAKSQHLSAQLRSLGRMLVAYSGGVDSAYLAWAAYRELGDNMLAVLADSPSLARSQMRDAVAFAEEHHIPLMIIQTAETERAEYRQNDGARCFHCKDELFTRIEDEVAGAYGLAAVAYGENADDMMRPDRPGSRAASNHEILRPLADAGLGKAAVRAIARALQLPSADKPAAPCLASRIPHYQEVSAAKLAQIEAAEKALRMLGFAESRVRHHGEVARVELPAGELVRAVSAPAREQIHAALTAAGFRFVAVDLAGIQSGAFTMSLLPVTRE